MIITILISIASCLPHCASLVRCHSTYSVQKVRPSVCITRVGQYLYIINAVPVRGAIIAIYEDTTTSINQLSTKPEKEQNLQELIILRDSLEGTPRRSPLPRILAWDFVRPRDAPKRVFVRILDRKGTIFVRIFVS